MKKPLLFLLLGFGLASMGCAVGADEDTVISDEPVDGSGQAVGNDRGLDAASGDEIQDTRASSRDQLDDNGIDHLSGDDEEEY